MNNNTVVLLMSIFTAFVFDFPTHTIYNMYEVCGNVTVVTG